MSETSRLEEWRRMWPLPLTAMLGVAASGTLPYSTGVFMEALTREFGWTKAQFTSAMTCQLILLLILLPLVGRATDRFGARRVALVGLLPAFAGTVSMGLADGEIWQWWLLHVIQSAGVALIVPPVWITAVAGRFNTSRGLALAITLAGIGAGTALWPILAATYIELFGWRLAYGALALSWAVPLLPLTLIFFHDASERSVIRRRYVEAPPPVRQTMLSPVFLLLAIAAGFFTIATYAMMVHLVPILREKGLSMTTAAWIAGVTGLFSIIGRIGTGVLLDSLPTKPFGVAAFLLPAAAAALLGMSAGSVSMLLAGAALLGLAMGAESDIVAFIAARRFAHAIFGTLFSVIQTITAVTALGGAMLAGFLFDMGGSYGLFLTAVVPLSFIGGFCILLLPGARPVPAEAGTVAAKGAVAAE
ncbi:MFS transporter [Sphingobium tyrosinilyticum]|uniref:MFS transporter n=1 Tax=Sphingobium tyrosinilyticum TaxID=2715436 RepID=A0ABV9F2A5_9SPHN